MGSCLCGYSSEEESARNASREHWVYRPANQSYPSRPSHIEVPTPKYVVQKVSTVREVSLHSKESGYGEYKCPQCGKFWKSLLSWPNGHQACKRCKTSVSPKNQRPVRESDRTLSAKHAPEHPQELCERCIELGYHCSRSHGRNRYRRNMV